MPARQLVDESPRAIVFSANFVQPIPAAGRRRAMIDHTLNEAAETIAAADALLIGTGAGMGVDSGLPDFQSTLRYSLAGWFRDPLQVQPRKKAEQAQQPAQADLQFRGRH